MRACFSSIGRVVRPRMHAGPQQINFFIPEEIMIEIEKGIKLPERNRYDSKYPWRHMDVGDSFVVPNTGKNKGNQQKIIKSFKTNAWKAGSIHGKKFRVGVDENEIVRCWRVE